MSHRPPATRDRRRAPLWQALLVTGFRVAARTLGHARPPARREPAQVWAPPRRRVVRRAARDLLAVVAVAAAVAQLAAVTMVAAIPPPQQWPSPSQPPVQVCGSSILNGPSSPPGGAVTIPAGDNSALFNSPLAPDTTYWFAPGTHTMNTGTFGQYTSIPVANGDVLTGGPGAVVDGMNYNYEAVDNPAATGVTIEYLTFQNFDTPGGQGAVTGFTGYTVQYTTVQDTIPGSGLYLGTNDIAEWNCLTANGQQGFAAYGTADVSALTGGVQNVTVDDNEISYNNQCNWENDAVFPITPPAGCAGAGQFSGCGCAGAGKFWRTYISQFENNYVHNDYDAGAWWDTDNTGMTVTGNYIAGEYAVGMIMEIGYNGLISGNTFVDDAWGVGPTNPGFPSSAVYINSSGADPRVPGPYGGSFAITGNTFIDNWGGVVLYETADRFCASVANTSTGTCTLVNPSANLVTCGQPYPSSPSRPQAAPWTLAGKGRTSTASGPAGARGRGGTGRGQNFTPLIQYQPYYSDCRWKTQNLNVSGNLFAYNPGDIPSCTTALYCGFNGLFSNYGITPPYIGYAVANTITYSQGNLFAGNTYCGPWQFDAFAQGNDFSFGVWQAAPYSQDPRSTLNGPACTSPQVGPPRAPVPQPVQVPIVAGHR
jgi:Right handed beta helix region